MHEEKYKQNALTVHINKFTILPYYGRQNHFAFSDFQKLNLTHFSNGYLELRMRPLLRGSRNSFKFLLGDLCLYSHTNLYQKVGLRYQKIIGDRIAPLESYF